MQHTFKTGDVVIERSENHTMAVSEVTDTGVVCDWFDGDQHHRGTFQPDQLVFVRH